MRPVPAEEPDFLTALEEYLASILADTADRHPRLQAAMRHAILDGGKRLRPLMLRAASRLGQGAEEEVVLLAAAAVELLHGYSLVHDDLPAMDDDDFRRGRPSCHKEYGESMAILAGDALQALAFESLVAALQRSSIDPAGKLEVIKRFAIAAGPEQLVGGQAADLEPRPGIEGDQALLWIHLRKTASLFRICLYIGGALGGLKAKSLDKLDDAGRFLGLAFQAMDDVLDASAPLEELGKTPGKDREQGKITFVELYGLERACRLADENLESALDLLPESPQGEPLRELAFRMVRRRR